MHATELEHIRSIKSFPSLLNYLRDELDWPIDSIEIEDLTFDYEPEELGLDAEAAVKIKEIKQLRPLRTNQPWGIFFINFAPKRLPVVILRRILRSLVIKKRALTKQARQQTWLLTDLLFISSYGEQEHRNITFAHFYEDTSYGDLPTLHVLGWDDEDTVLHLEHAHQTLKQKLTWPSNTNDLDEWKKSWSEAFTIRHREVITTSKELSIRLATLARSIRKRANAILKVESERGPLRKLHAAFKESLIHDLSEDDFADMYAQTISYGLLTARVSRPSGLVADNIAEMVPVTNPFLKELLETFLHVGGRKSEMDFDELGINDVVDLLRRANMEAILRDFGNRNPNEDPVIHFYELFLKEYDAKKRMQRGVFFTPLPVVSFIVRSVHELLQTEFGLEDGLASTITWGEMQAKLALLSGEGRGEVGEDDKDFTIPAGVSPDDPFVLILDIASGTGTFMVMVIDVIYKTMITKWEKQGHSETERKRLWNEYVPDHLLPRLFGYELMMAPYAIAHMKIGLKLSETGYRFHSNERVHLYLTNTLEPPQDFSDRLAFDVPALAHEALAVNAVKRSKRFTVVIGNPPYAYNSVNIGEWINGLIREYYQVNDSPLNERNPKGLQDDYVKFIRFAQHSIQQSNVGTLGLITNHSYLDNPTFRGMRNNLINSFSILHVLDLHGNSKKMEKSPDGYPDENVFDIQQGVAISIGTRRNNDDHCEIIHTDLWGKREQKYSSLSNLTSKTLRTTLLEPDTPFYLLIPQDNFRKIEFESFYSITDVFPFNSMGVTTGDDDRCVAYNSDELFNTFKKRTKISEYLYRPFDKRYVYYDTNVLERARFDFMKHLIEHNNKALITIRRPRNKKFGNFFVSNWLTDKCFISSLDNCQVFPLYKISTDKGLSFVEQAFPNINSTVLKNLRVMLDIPDPGNNRLNADITPEYFFNYTYAVFHSLEYRNRYAEFLKIDFPRVPLTSSIELFRELAKLGGELVALHLMESPKLEDHFTKWKGTTPSNSIEKVTYSDETVWINKDCTQGFFGVSEEVWNFHIGGYQVCHKWLKDRKGRTLTKEDIEHYHRIVVALSETIRIMKEIDEVIERYGGWPLVGSTDPIPTTDEHPQEEIIFTQEPQSVIEEIEEETEEEVETEQPSSRTYNSIEEVEYEEIICTIRQVFTEYRELDRDTAIREVSHALGFQRTGDHIYEVIDGAMIAAVRRRIISTVRGISTLDASSIEYYSRDELIDYLKTVVGRAWTSRSTALKSVARYLGFKRAGKNIESAFKSAINGGIRRGEFESDGEMIRVV